MVTKRKLSVKAKGKRDPKRTSRSLLEAGIEIFSTVGYSGAAVDDIVDKAGCNKRMLYHYYGNKEGLYIAVLREVFAKLETLEADALESVDDPAAAIRAILTRYFDFLQQNPDFVNLLLWENLNGGRMLDEHPGLLSKAPILESLKKILEKNCARGVGNRTPHDPRHVLVLLIGVCFIYFSNRHTLRHTVGLALDRPSVVYQGLNTATDILLHGIIDNRPTT